VARRDDLVHDGVPRRRRRRCWRSRGGRRRGRAVGQRGRGGRGRGPGEVRLVEEREGRVVVACVHGAARCQCDPRVHCPGGVRGGSVRGSKQGGRRGGGGGRTRLLEVAVHEPVELVRGHHGARGWWWWWWWCGPGHARRWWCCRRGGTRCASEAGAGRDLKRVAWLLRGEDGARASRGSSRRGGRGGSRWGGKRELDGGRRRGGRKAATPSRATAALSLEQPCRHHSSSSSRHLRASTSSMRRLACVHLVPPLPSSLSLSSSILISLTPRLHHHTARAPDLPRSGADKGRPPDPGPRLYRPLLGPVRPSSPPLSLFLSLANPQRTQLTRARPQLHQGPAGRALQPWRGGLPQSVPSLSFSPDGLASSADPSLPPLASQLRRPLPRLVPLHRQEPRGAQGRPPVDFPSPSPLPLAPPLLAQKYSTSQRTHFFHSLVSVAAWWSARGSELGQAGRRATLRARVGFRCARLSLLLLLLLLLSCR